jgi:large subunit ribosomal protein L22
MSPKETPPGADGPKADEEKAKVEAEAAESKAKEAQEEAAEEAEATAEPGEPEPKEEPKAKRRRRGSSETTAGSGKKSTRRDPGEVVNVRARARYVRTAPRKARLVMDHIRDKDVEQARAVLAHAPRAAAVDVLKLLDSAVANAEHNHELGPDELRVRRAYVDEGPTIKRYRPRALGRATPINKRTSHMTIELTTEGKE